MDVVARPSSPPAVYLQAVEFEIAGEKRSWSAGDREWLVVP